MTKIKQDSGLTGYLKSKNAMVFFVFLTVIITMPNTFYVYCMFSDFTPFWKTSIGVASAFVVAGFIMVYTLLKEYQVAKWYAYFEIMVSTYYYIRVINNRPDLTWWDLIPALGFTIILPVSVYKAAAQLEKMDAATSEPEPEPFDLPTISAEQLAPIIERALMNPPVKKKAKKVKNKVADEIIKEFVSASPDKVVLVEKGEQLGASVSEDKIKFISEVPPVPLRYSAKPANTKEWQDNDLPQ
jgi:hypothetical protein